MAGMTATAAAVSKGSQIASAVTGATGLLGSLGFGIYDRIQAKQRYNHELSREDSSYLRSAQDLLNATNQSGISASTLLGITPAQSTSNTSFPIGSPIDTSSLINALISKNELDERARQFDATLSQQNKFHDDEMKLRENEIITEYDFKNKELNSNYKLAVLNLDQQKSLAEADLNFNKNVQAREEAYKVTSDGYSYWRSMCDQFGLFMPVKYSDNFDEVETHNNQLNLTFSSKLRSFYDSNTDFKTRGFSVHNSYSAGFGNNTTDSSGANQSEHYGKVGTSFGSNIMKSLGLNMSASGAVSTTLDYDYYAKSALYEMCVNESQYYMIYREKPKNYD